MKNAMKFDVTYQDGRAFEAKVMPRDMVNFERQFNASVADFESGVRMEWIYYLAWSVLHRLRQHTGDFDSFLDTVESVEAVDGGEDEETPAEAADPTQPEVSPAA